MGLTSRMVHEDAQGLLTSETTRQAMRLEDDAYRALVAADRRNSAQMSPAPADAPAALVLEGPQGPLLFLRGTPHPLTVAAA